MARPAFTFADLFAGIGGFHAALTHAGGRCVYVSEIDDAARATYLANWVEPLPPAERPRTINHDINTATPLEGALVGVPKKIDVLTAGFPCQPFSKSGYQRGMDETRGTLFFNILRILEERTPAIILLENVRNLVGPRHTHEWEVIIDRLHKIGYRVSSTPSVFSPHLLPPSLGGTPQVRDRVFILGTFVGAGNAPDPKTVPPTIMRGPVDGWDPMRWRIDWALDPEDEIQDLARYELSTTERGWIDYWQELIEDLPAQNTKQRLPGFPLWADHWIPYKRLLSQGELEAVPGWKADFMVKNARYYDENRRVIDAWKADRRYEGLPPSRRKLEWQAQDLESLWHTVMHFRPSGIRCKQPTYLPALVAITQTSIIGPRQRRLTPHEAARLQGLPRSFTFGDQRDPASYKQVGNGVCVGAAWHALRMHVEQDEAGDQRIPAKLRRAILHAPVNPSPDSLSPKAQAVESVAPQASPQTVCA